MNVKENIQHLRTEIPQNVKIIAVSKTKPIELINQAIDAGQIDFGENRVQELVLKAKQLPTNIHWHMIGHLQTNKVKLLLPYVSLIHSVDSYKLASEINKEAIKLGKNIPCLLQVHIALEDTKYGFTDEELFAFLDNPQLKTFKNITITGLMGMATFTDNEIQIRKEFKHLRKLFEEIKKNYFPNEPHFKELSMGMSNDYRIAIEEGSTMVRIGSLIFGERNYL